jgi:hypothetical protein
VWIANRTSNPAASELLVRFPLFPPDETIFASNRSFRFTVSPDGRHITFVADMNSATSLWLRSFDSPRTILFAAGTNQPIFQVSAAGGVPQPATRLATGLQETHGNPSFLPDGRRFLFASVGHPDKAGVWIGVSTAAIPFVCSIEPLRRRTSRVTWCSCATAWCSRNRSIRPWAN